jgi:hypothetical protein
MRFAQIPIRLFWLQMKLMPPKNFAQPFLTQPGSELKGGGTRGVVEEFIEQKGGEVMYLPPSTSSQWPSAQTHRTPLVTLSLFVLILYGSAPYKAMKTRAVPFDEAQPGERKLAWNAEAQKASQR